MAIQDREKWDRQHAAAHRRQQPAGFLKQIFEAGAWQIEPGRALDIATGKGRNAIFLAERGFEVVAIDISPVALGEARKHAAEKHLSISWQQADLEKIELPENAYDLIVNFNYLQRTLVPQLKAALKVGGHVIFETYLIDQQTIGHPKNPDYLLHHNELLDLFDGFRILYYREGRFNDSREDAFRAGLLARKLS
jgi:2-polyprenyl-3-methyl-5-hydroxy-6-metoxy-1,4-benzoquinol methylase